VIYLEGALSCFAVCCAVPRCVRYYTLVSYAPVVYSPRFLYVDTDDLGSQTSRSVDAVVGSEVQIKREPSYDDFIMDDDMGTYVTCSLFGARV
jgi:hypothetical protein